MTPFCRPSNPGRGPALSRMITDRRLPYRGTSSRRPCRSLTFPAIAICNAGAALSANNRFAAHNSNHRYTTSLAIYSAKLAAGWTGENTVFCAPL